MKYRGWSISIRKSRKWHPKDRKFYKWLFVKASPPIGTTALSLGLSGWEWQKQEMISELKRDIDLKKV